MTRKKETTKSIRMTGDRPSTILFHTVLPTHSTRIRTPRRRRRLSPRTLVERKPASTPPDSNAIQWVRFFDRPRPPQCPSPPLPLLPRLHRPLLCRRYRRGRRPCSPVCLQTCGRITSMSTDQKCTRCLFSKSFVRLGVFPPV